MKNEFLKLFLLVVAAMFLSVEINAQTGQNPNNRDQIPEYLRKKLVEMRIAKNKKEFNKLIERSEAVAKLGDEIHSSFEKYKTLTADDEKKLNRVAKLLKKIRRELNAKRDNKSAAEKGPKSLLDAIDNLQKNTTFLFKELKRSTRHSISVAAIQSSNAIWKLVKFIRLRKKR